MSSRLVKHETHRNKDLYFSRAGKASMNKFKILLDKEKILYGSKKETNSFKTKSLKFFKPKFVGQSSSDENLYKLVKFI